MHFLKIKKQDFAPAIKKSPILLPLSRSLVRACAGVQERESVCVCACGRVSACVLECEHERCSEAATLDNKMVTNFFMF